MRRILTAMVASAVLAAPAWANELPAALIDPLIKIQGALAADQMTDLAADAAAVETAATALGAAAAPIASSARTLAAAADLKTARTAFGEVTDAVLAYAEKTTSGLGADVRLGYCPMANKSWLTRDKTIKNPYYGLAMLTCGSFKK